MAGINVDENLCARCGICANVCAFGLINLGNENQIPIQGTGRGICFNCGHCEAFCPNGAIILDFALGENCKEVDLKKSLLDIPGNVLGNYLKKRRSIRHFTPEIVEKEKIEEIMDIVCYSASGTNAQPVRWIVVYEKKEVQKLASLTVDWMRYFLETNHPMSAYPLVEACENGLDLICWDAPHLLIGYIPENNPSAPADAIIALTHFDIIAPAFGLGTCWAGFVTTAARSWEPLQKALALPDGYVIGYAMMFGYPQYKPHNIPRRNPVQITWK